MIIPTLKLLGFAPLDLVTDIASGKQYMVTREYKLHETKVGAVDIEFEISMRLQRVSTVISEGMNTYTIPSEKILIMEKPIDMTDEDWEKYKERESYKVHLRHNPIFDAPVAAANVAITTHKFGFISSDGKIEWSK